MNIRFKRMMSVLLCCVMLFGMIPVDAFATGENADSSITAEEKTVDGTATVLSADESVLPVILSENTVTEEPVADQPAAVQPPVEEPVQKFYEELMAFETYEELRAYLDNMTAEQLQVMNQFTYEQTQALNERMKALQGVSAAPVSDEPVVEEEGTEEEIADETITSEQPASKETETTEGAAEETIQEETVVSDEIQVEEKVTSDDAANAQVPAENQNGDVDALFARLMAAATYEELDAMMEAMSEEEYALMRQFSDEQNAALTARANYLNEYNNSVLADITIAQGETKTHTVGSNFFNYSCHVYKNGTDVTATAGITATDNGGTITISVSESTATGEYEIGYGYNGWRGYSEVGRFTISVVAASSSGSGTTTGPAEEIQRMTYDKKAIANGDGTYELSLSVSGSVGSATSKALVDVIFIVDNSNSMYPNYSTFMSSLKPAMQSLVRNISETNGDKIDARYAIARFGTNSEIYQTFDNSTNTISNISAISQYANVDDGGTNYQAGIYRGKQLLNSRRDGATTVVVFVTDGLPTFRGAPNKTNGNGQNDNSGYNINAAVEEIGGMSCNYFYCIGIGSDFTNAGTTANQNMTRLTNAVNAGTTGIYAVSNGAASELEAVFNKITAQVTTFLCNHVTITDTLRHVDSELMVRVTDPSSVMVTVRTSDKVYGPDASVTLPATENNKETTTLTAHYDSEKSILTLAFPDEYQLEPDYTYVISATIEPTEKAYQEYRDKNGYTDEGGANTGTHSGERGFYANDSATITYTFSDGVETKTETKDYPMPVIQLNPGTLVIEKKINGLEKEQYPAMAFPVTLTFPGKAAQTEIIPFEIFTDEDGDGIYTHPMGGMSPNTLYSVTESGYELEDYDVSASVTGTDEAEGIVASGTIKKGETDTVSFTNTYKLAKIAVSGRKVWNDNNNQDGIRPASITVNLLANGNVVASKVVTEADNWGWTFEAVDKYDKDGNEIVYTVTEEAVEGYTAKIEGFTITNTHTPSVIDIKGAKTWEDNNNQDGIRPESITINLKADGEIIATKTVTEADGWAWSFEGLPEYEAGKKIAYTITEKAVTGYTPAVNGYNVTNTHIPAKISIPVTKTWIDAENQDGFRPGSVTIKLLADDVDTGKRLFLNETNGWKDSFTNLDKYAAGKEIVYTVTEEEVNNYTSVITGNVENGYVVTNSHTPETINIKGTKTWDDADNQDGKRPVSITVRLLADGTEVDSKTVTVADDWAWNFTGMPKYKDGVEIKYTITEDDVDEYNKNVVGYDVVNTHAPETIDIEGIKRWVDENNQDGIRPESITVNLMANGEKVNSTTASAATNWKWSFKGLAKYEAGKEIVYTVTEEAVDGYEASIDGFDITNTHEIEKTSISGTKTWDDANNQDGKRPDSITVRLWANGTEVASQEVKPNDNGEWTYSFTNLDKFAAGKEISYTVTEDQILDAEGDEVAYNASYDGYNITNTYNPEKTNVTVIKRWVDADDQDGKRPASIKVTLFADGEKVGLLGKSLTLSEENGWKGTFEDLDKYKDGVEIVYTVTEEEVKDYTADIDGFTITNTHTPETIDIEGTKTWDDNDNQDGIRPDSITVNLMANGVKTDSIRVTAKNYWAWSFQGVPKYAGGEEIVYTVTEDDVDGYEATIKGFDITNTHNPETITIEGTKTWVDNDNQDGKRPTSITVNLLADGTEVKEAIVTATTDWNWKFTDLPKYRDGGKEIVYTVTEEAVDGYEASIDGFDIANTHEIEKTSLSGTKIWEDNNNQDGKRPTSIIINLTANNVKVDSKEVSPDENGLWSWTFDNLDKYKDGKEITYGFLEEKVEEYTTTYNGTEITNTHAPYKTSVQVSKIWDDNYNQDGMRPNDVTIILVADDVETEQKLVLNESNGWKGTFEGLDKYKAGQEIKYTVMEEAIETGAYTATITGNVEEGYVVTNTHEVEKISISGTKTWKDENNQDGKRPKFITVNLLANGREVNEQLVKANDKGEWTYTFDDLDKYSNGQEIKYTVTEDTLKDAEGNDLGYSASYKNYDITNTYDPEKTSINVTKVWEDADDQDGKRPESIKVTLLADGKKIGLLGKSVTLSEKNEWKGSFENLDKYRDGGIEIEYTVVEEEVVGYDAVISGEAPNIVITNVHEPEIIEKLAGTKTWEDDNNRDGKRPESITVRLLANGKEVKHTTVTAEDKWSYEFTNLPKYDAGEEITYTVTEDRVENYSTEYDRENLNITNKYTPGRTSITVTKRWIDGSNYDGIRPGSVTIYLYANGVKIDSMKLTGKDNWVGVFDDLYVYENGKPIEYTIAEKSVSGYNITITGNAETGFTVTNTHNIIPKTGDESNLPLYTGLFGASFSAMAVLLFLAKPRKKGKYLR